MEVQSGAVQVEVVSSIRRRMRYAVPASQVGAAFGAVIARINAKARLPGFRPGKAPAAMIERMYGAEVRRQVLDKLLQDTVFTSLREAAIPAVGTPEVEGLSELKRGEDLQVTLQVEVMPELTMTGYEGAELTADTVVPDADDLQQVLDAKADARAEMVSVQEPAAAGHEVEVDFSAHQVGSDDAPVVGQRRVVQLGADRIDAAIEAAMLGVKAGEQVDKVLAAPENSTEFEAGKDVAVTVTVHDVRKQVVPAIDDELAKDLGFDSLAAWKAAATQEISEDAEHRSRELRRRAAVDHLISVNTIEVPPSVVERYVDEQLYSAFGRLPEQTRKMLSGYLDNLRKSLASDAEKSLRRSLALEAIATAHAIAVDDAEVEAEIERLAAKEPDRRDALVRQYAEDARRQELRRRLQHEKSMDLLVAQAKWSEGATKTLRAVKAEASKQSDVDRDDHDHDDHDHDHDHHDHDHAGHHHHDHEGHDHEGHDHEGHDHG